MISRMYCKQCASETLHQGMACVHCGESIAAVVVPPKKKLGFANAKQARPYSIEHRGEHLSLKQIAKLEGIAYETLTQRFRNGLRGDALVAKVPPMRARPKVRAA